MRLPKPSALAPALAGPTLIVVAVIVVLHDIVFGGRFSHLNPDVPSVFLLNHCFLGESLRSGQIPDWNPLTMTGAPFTGDPQAGWMYLAPMLLYTAFRCSVALRLFLILPPLVAGLGLYSFLRGERLSRVAATCGGLVLAMLIASTKVLVNLPFSDTLAWTPVILAAAAKAIRATTWAARLVWITVTAIAWGQLATAHLSHGLVIGTTTLVAYAIYVARAELRAGTTTGRQVAAIAALLVVAFPLVNLAHLLPIAAYVPRSSLGLGYDGMNAAAAALRGDVAPSLEIFRALDPPWPLRLATAPGMYLGAIPLALAFGGFWDARTRRLATTFAALALLFYALGLYPVAEALSPIIDPLPFADFYPHSPGRFLYGALFAIVVLCALGIDAWRMAPGTKRRWLMFLPGLVLWGLAPLVAGAFPSRLVIFAVGAVVGVVVLLAASRHASIALLLPVVLAVELVGSALIGQAHPIRFEEDGLETSGSAWLPMMPLPEPALDAGDYVRGGRLARAIKPAEPDEGRLVVMGEGLTTMFRPAVAGVEMGQGYNPVELRRYWSYHRSIVPGPIRFVPADPPASLGGIGYKLALSFPVIRYNLSIFPVEAPPPTTLALLQAGWVALPPALEPPEGVSEVARDARHVLYRADRVTPRAMFVAGWTRTSEAAALERITAPDFDPEREVVLEREPGIPLDAVGPPSTVTYEQLRPDRVSIDVATDNAGIVVVHNAWDVNWSATVDGEPAEVMAANYFLQGIPVGPGRHEIELEYEDPTVVPGLVVSAASLALLLGSALVARLRQRRRADRLKSR